MSDPTDKRADAAVGRQLGRWTWMRRYRIWEANRKVFLDPENYLEPELRDDAKPIAESEQDGSTPTPP